MRKFYLFITLSLIFMSYTSAQTAYITGKIINTNSEPLPYSAVVLKNISDTTTIRGTISAEDGSFAIEANDGIKYILDVSILGYKHYTTTCSTGDIGVITMEEMAQHLDAVTVIGDKIDHKPNGYSVYLENDPITDGRQVNEMLSFLPGVNADDDAVQIFSREVHAIYINGIKIQDIVELNAIQASDVESIDIDYISGVEEAADAKGGVIRIQLKKMRDGGYSGYLQAAAGINMYGYNGESIYAMYRARYGKLSIHNTASYSRGHASSYSENEYTFKEMGKKIISKDELSNWNGYIFDRLNLTYDINDKHIIGVSGFFNMYKGNPYTMSYNIEEIDTTNIFSPTEQNKFQGVFNYTWKINDNGGKFTATADFLRTENIIEQYFYAEQKQEEFDSKSVQSTNMMRFRPILDLPLWAGMLTSGLDLRYLDFIDNSNSHAQCIQTTMKGWQPAAFVQYSGEHNMFMYEVGIRVQQNYMNVHTVDVTNENSKLGILPSVSLIYMLNPEKGHLLALDYKRSMDELPYSAISPFKQYYSPYSYVVGNPNLVPRIQDEVMLIAGFFDIITAMAGYIHVSNPIMYITKADPEIQDVIYSMPENGDFYSMTILGLEADLQLCKWWILKPSITYMMLTGKTSQYSRKNDGGWQFRLNNNFNFTPTFGGGLNLYYETKRYIFDALWKPVGQVSGSLYKSFFNKQLECRLNFKLYQIGRQTIIETPEAIQSEWNKTKEQFVRLTLTWNFSGGKKVNVKRTANSIQDYEETSDMRK